ncbi:hypothetical protein [Paenibacillus sanfengchensis]|uniref:TlpA family protein disulfide reductase n=1 Tax=Paenibacillus sanfengchensis TaxID=3119819 RepID=UPI002FE32EC9
MKKTLDSLKTLFVSSRAKGSNTALTEGKLPRGGNDGDFLPLFKGRDQMGRKVRSETFPGRITKLIFLSDSCASCIEVLKRLDHSPRNKHCLVIKGDPEPYSNADLEDISYDFPIFRSTKVVAMFGIQRVPTIVTVSAEGRIERVDELTDPGQLEDCLEPSSPVWPRRNQGLPVGSVFPDALSRAGHAQEGAGEGAVVLFLSVDCLSCLDIFSKIHLLVEKWTDMRIVLYIQGEEVKVKMLLEENRISLPFFLYDPGLRGTFRTLVFPYLYVLSAEGRILSRGSLKDAEELDIWMAMAVEQGGREHD